MGASVNYVELIGRVGKDPEVRYTQAGKAVANFTLATDESYKDNSGEKVKKTEWHTLVAWGQSVENFIQPYIHKGDLIRVTGKLQTRKWTDKNDVERYTTEVNVQDIRGLVSANKEDAGTQTQSTKVAARPAARLAAARPAARPATRPVAQPDPEPTELREPGDEVDDELGF